ncbi:5-formyltetrahydrofolate cyclo-ligase [Pustulibacterium marinum]|uniref:5-formyltetrahydrofolate cyclo-ligase n=1 Tax=Pustulibacterium marinum TaxID=1224947 RepID=A0A1I7HCC9_9FLAO|nr:5-formyltetrahydrofolate cyclo-ligase [Pustulibacterium marinum]SFU58380.1 5-formyltetrahydrofolate cyclo-ligase [Pustulibacterium marinum]
MNKNELRKKYNDLRQNLSETQVEDLSIDIANQLLQLPIWNKVYYHTFLSISEKKEIDTSFLLSILQGKDKEVVISKSNFDDGSLTHFLLTENTRIKKNKWNIPEPVDGLEVPETKIDVVFVPLLAFDTNGQRLGYGKGFYDIFLSKCKPETIKIGLSFFEAEPVFEEVFETDIALNYCVTPSKTYHFKN